MGAVMKWMTATLCRDGRGGIDTGGRTPSTISPRLASLSTLYSLILHSWSIYYVRPSTINDILFCAARRASRRCAPKPLRWFRLSAG
ncbi:hypothetical protein J6590_057622 [Homalodisca vitripennis]|nr:hypothetical protein J6590_087010 [Homalodisca vitripennis]KAG8286536.1 hypothetical protein J6590_057622 [Homalodisca vitripennis]